jgi:hypothetical protein
MATSRHKSKSASTSKRRQWTDGEIRVLKQYKGKKTAAQIGKLLKRSEGGVRQKGLDLGISLAVSRAA